MFSRKVSIWKCTLLVLVAIMCINCSPGAKLTADSKNDECRNELIGSLGAFAREAGLNFQTSKSDADSVFSTGEVAKSYGRDGMRITSHFGLEAADGGCNLKLYKQAKEGPGSSSTTSGNYGSIKLTKCKCKKE